MVPEITPAEWEELKSKRLVPEEKVSDKVHLQLFKESIEELADKEKPELTEDSPSSKRKEMLKYVNPETLEQVADPETGKLASQHPDFK